MSSNNVRVTLKVGASNLPPVAVACREPVQGNPSPFSLAKQTVANGSVQILIAYEGDFQGHLCDIAITSRLTTSMVIDTQPPSYFIPDLTMQRVNTFTILLQLTLLISMVAVVCFHVLTPSLTATFICSISLYVVSFFNVGKVPAMVLKILLAFREIALAVGWAEADEYSKTGSLGLDTAEMWMGWPYWVFFLGFVLFGLLCRSLKRRLGPKLKGLLRTPIRHTLRFVHCSFFMYEPLVLALVVRGVRKSLSVWDTLYLVMYAFAVFGTLVMLWKITYSNRRIFVASDGPCVRVLIYLYTIPVVVAYPNESSYGSLLAIVFMVCLFCSRTYYRVKEWQFETRTEELRSDRSESEEEPSRPRFFRLREKIETIQQFFNDLFFIVNNALILFVTFWGSPSFATSLVLTGVNIGNLLAFLVVNLVLIVWAGFVKVHAVLKKPRRMVIHP